MTYPPALVQRVASVIGRGLAEAVEVLDALVVPEPDVVSQTDGRIRLDWPDGVDPDRSPADGVQHVLVDARLLGRLVEQLNGYRNALGVRDFAEHVGRPLQPWQVGYVAQAFAERTPPTNAPAADPPPVCWTGPDPRDEGYTEAEAAAAWTLAVIGRLPAAEAYARSILRDYMGSRAYAVAEATSFATTPDECAAVREAARVLGVAP